MTKRDKKVFSSPLRTLNAAEIKAVAGAAASKVASKRTSSVDNGGRDFS
ncbi:hypothetical protein [Sphingobium sp. Sx8-8]|nr:hypothetical protein [Sphingobium sp. Sx8-8]